MDQAEVIDKVRRYVILVRQQFDISRVVLFGSYAKGNANQYSDIDVALVVKKMDKGFFEVEPVLWKLRRQIDPLIEPVLIEEDNDPAGFLEEISKSGIEIFG
ncbi:MAG: nucleotidyltransferase domain-containing protein [Bacteroidetes bacterium]|nr:nucleotidyltransferase domain-containing protein [Bacteroidota bacterium]